MIKNIFFDFDGVITLNENAYTLVPENIHKYCPEIPIKKTQECYDKFKRPLQLGDKTHFDIWDQYCKCLGKELPTTILIKSFENTPINALMVNLIKKISKKYSTGIITNNSKERLKTIIDKFNLIDLFKSITLSSQIGSTKTEKKIFEIALTKANVKANESIFIDNHESNLLIPEEMGFNTYFFDLKQNDISKLEKYFNKLGITV